MPSFGGYLVLLVLAAVSALLLNLSYRLFRADRVESEKSAARTGTLLNALLGRARIHDDWAPDARVQGGMLFNRRKKRIEICGRLSKDSLDRVFR